METQESKTSILNDHINKWLEELGAETDAARASARMQAYLDFCASAPTYSARNVILIRAANPCARQVMGAGAWRKLGRYIKQGERAIQILAPIIVTRAHATEQQQERIVVGFKSVNVFDVSQTAGAALPQPPDWSSAERSDWLHARLSKFAATLGIAVEERILPTGVLGVSTGGRILLAPGASTATYIHEICHELLHHAPDAPTESSLREYEAESSAYIIARRFHLGVAQCPTYLALHGATSVAIMARMERIRAAASRVIGFVEKAEEQPIAVA